MKVSDLKPLEKNPFKSKGDAQIKRIAKSIQEFERMMEIRRIVIDEDNNILGGNKRYFALKKLGYKEIPDAWIEKVEGLTEEQKKEFIVKDNAHWGSEWDYELLGEWNVDLDAWGVGDVEFVDEKEVKEDDYEIPDEIETDIVLGDLIEIGEHRLLCGDSTDSEQVSKLMNGDKVDMVFTSPPYNINSKMYETYKDNLKSNEYIDFNLKVAKNIKQVLKGMLFWNISYNKNARWEFLEIANRIRKDIGFNFLELIVWNKKTALPVVSKNMLTRKYEDIFVYSNEDEYTDIELYCVLGNQKDVVFNKKTSKILTNYWEIGTNKTQLKNHLACFPVKVPGNAILLSTNETDKILDVFIGSGSTMVAAHQLNRKCYGMEIEPKYCQIIIDRMRNLDPNLVIKKNGIEI